MFRAFALLCVFMMPLSVQAASFDCAKAEHKLEKTICENPNLSALDEQVAALYQERRETLFDREALRVQQNNWQQILREKCKTECNPVDVEADYNVQLTTLKNLNEEVFTANYKTNDIATLVITHINKDEFDFTFTREYLDEPENKLCKLPADDGEAGAIAKLADLQHAEWSNGECTLKFKLQRGDKDSVVGIKTEGTDACRSYCADDNFTLDDNFIPENVWAASNQ